MCGDPRRVEERQERRPRAGIGGHVDGEALILWKGLPGIKVPLRARKDKSPAVTALQQALKDDNPEVGDAAKEALKKINPDAAKKKGR